MTLDSNNGLSYFQQYALDCRHFLHHFLAVWHFGWNDANNVHLRIDCVVDLLEILSVACKWKPRRWL